VRIVVCAGKGVGATRLSAFDAALWDAGIGDYNLIHLSSVIPAGCIVEEGKHLPRRDEVGWKLYCVLSTSYRASAAEGGWAGLGWASTYHKGGILIEEVGETRDEVADKIEKAYRDMLHRRGDIGDLHASIVQAPAPVPHSCAAVAALFAAVPWSRE